MRLGKLLLLVVISSCSTQHYIDKAGKAATSASAAAITRATKNKDYVSLQSGTNFYYVTFAEIDKAKKNVTVTLDKIDSIHYNQVLISTNNKVLVNDNPPKPHLHIKLVDSTNYTYDEPHTIPLMKISSMQKL